MERKIPNHARFLVVDLDNRIVLVAPQEEREADEAAQRLFSEGKDVAVCHVLRRFDHLYDSR